MSALGPARPRSAAALASMGVRKSKVSGQGLRARVSKRVLADAKAEIRGRENETCGRCGERAGEDPHHRINRGMGGASSDPTAHALSNLVWICRPCHDWIGANPVKAGHEGFLIRHGRRRPAAVPLRYRGEWVLLDDDGAVTPWSPPTNNLNGES